MGLMLARLVFLAFIGLTGFITYNALYLQELRNQTVVPKIIRGEMPPPALARPTKVVVTPQQAPKIPAVTTNLPPLQGQEAPEQLVTAIQRELAARGYGSGQADGKLDEDTRKAIAAFEKDKGLPVTGSPTDELLRYILLGETAQSGPNTGSVTSHAANAGKKPSAEPKASAKTDATVKKVQQILAELGYAPGPADGAMGEETERAVSAFQRDRKLSANGRITPELLQEIKSVTGRDLASSTPQPVN
jgi:peptidoglycan hydrolase-like protein with peptidoglycan-binding domain